jgi:hypothetical protein
MFKKSIQFACMILISIGMHAQKSNLKLKKMESVKEVNSYVHFHGAPSKGKILMVVSSPSISKQTGWHILFWAAELTYIVRVFVFSGF